MMEENAAIFFIKYPYTHAHWDCILVISPQTTHNNFTHKNKTGKYEKTSC